MDSVAALLDGPRARDAFVLRASLDPPWSLRVQDEAPMTVVALLRGEACLVTEDGAVTRCRPGDVALLRGPDPYVVCDQPSTAPQVVIHPGQRCTTPEGQPLGLLRSLGVRAWGSNLEGATAMLVGTYQQPGEISQRLLGSLPPLVVLSAQSWDTPLLGFLADEARRDEPGQDAVLDRLLDLLLVAVLREWFRRPAAEPPGWYLAHGDPVVGSALRLIREEPARPWTVASLASATGVSRAALARRFTELVGEPPMAYLTGWRLSLAADLLREPGSTVGAVARQVGYGSAFALSTAFTRVRGVSPTQHRAATSP